MFTHSNNFLDYVTLGSTFALALSLWGLWVGMCGLRSRARSRRVEQRLGIAELSPSEKRVLRLWYDGREVTTAVPRGERRASLLGAWEEQIRAAGWEQCPRRVLVLAGAMVATVALLAYMLTDRALVGAAGASATALILWTFVKHRASQRTAAFETQFVDALELAARSLRSGHPLVGSFRLIAEEIPPPVGPLFGGICQKQDMGASIADALAQAAATCTGSDMRLFATSVAIQLRSGGNLADMMDRLASVIRDRERLSRRLRVLTAQTLLSKRVLIVLPVGLFALLNVISPKYMETLYATTAGHWLLACAGIGLLLGTWVMNRMAALRY